ncbi:hypothetical protein [Microtetraspora sp. NBRC 13810]|uniref:hypothetical protein n=1 Tax=Microtetraspora sp. NBRC 13810 TaxID=3030990 RepID=UPI002552DA09|nr:hypothetical protein [Microtetraspora sp. NBRC 13810]
MRVLRGVGFGVRVLLLAVLAWGVLVTGASSVPFSRTVEQFRGAVVAGQVDRVSYDVGDSGEVVALVWSQSPLTWYQVEGWVADSVGTYTEARLRADLDRVPARPSVVREARRGDFGGILPDWPFRYPGGSSLWWIAAAWVAAFVLMLGSTPRLANRWAWFWMFTVGQVGALLFLVLEPRPLWRGPGEGVTRANRVDGSRGCGYAFLLGIVSVLVPLGVGWLLGPLLG